MYIYNILLLLPLYRAPRLLLTLRVLQRYANIFFSQKLSQRTRDRKRQKKKLCWYLCKKNSNVTCNLEVDIYIYIYHTHEFSLCMHSAVGILYETGFHVFPHDILIILLYT